MKTLITLFLSLLALNVYSQSNNIDDYYVDFAIPDNAATTLLGIAPNKVSRPGNVKDIGFQLLNTVSEGGNLSTGLALEWSPLMSFNKNLKTYKDNYIFNRMQFSIATAKQSKGNGIDLAIGYKVTLIDDADPYKDDKLIEDIQKLMLFESGIEVLKGNFLYEFKNYCLKDLKDEKIYDALINGVFDYNKYSSKNIPIEGAFLQEVTKAITGVNPNYPKETLDGLMSYAKRFLLTVYDIVSNKSYETANKLISERKEQYLKSKWNAKSLQFSTGLISTSDSATIKTLQLKRWSSFLGYAQDISTWGQLLLQAQYITSWNNLEDFKNKAMLGGRLLFGNGTFRGSLEGLFSYSEKSGVDINRNLRTTLGLEFKMSDGLWLEAAFGLDSPVKEFKGSSLLSLANLKYTFAKKRRIHFNI